MRILFKYLIKNRIELNQIYIENINKTCKKSYIVFLNYKLNNINHTTNSTIYFKKNTKNYLKMNNKNPFETNDGKGKGSKTIFIDLTKNDETNNSNDVSNSTTAPETDSFNQLGNYHRSRSIPNLCDNQSKKQKESNVANNYIPNINQNPSSSQSLYFNPLSTVPRYGNRYPVCFAQSNIQFFTQNTVFGNPYVYNQTKYSYTNAQTHYNYVPFNRSDNESSTTDAVEAISKSINFSRGYEQDKKLVDTFRRWIPVTPAEIFSDLEGINFTVLSYNVLAQDLVQEHSYIYKNHSARALIWETRWKNLLKEIKDYNADIICLQEVQESHIKSYYSKIDKLGYGSLFKKRTTPQRSDGCAIYYRKSMFKLVENTTVEYNQGDSLLNRDNVAIIAKFASKEKPSAEFVIATTHLLYNPRRTDVRLAQTQLLLTEVERIAYNGELNKKYLPMIITGDFNSEPDSPIFELIHNGYLKYENLTYRSLKPSNDSKELAGKVLIPSCLKITDNCQHYEILQSRLKGVKLPRSMENKLINLRHSKRQSEIDNSFKGDDKLFSTGRLSHDLNLKSVFNYFNDDDFEATTYQSRWITVDYIFYSVNYNNETRRNSEGKLKLISKYRIPNTSEMKQIQTIPNFSLGSDHLALLSKFKLVY